MWCNMQTRVKRSYFNVTNFFLSYYFTEIFHPFLMQDWRWNVTEKNPREGDDEMTWHHQLRSIPLLQSVKDKVGVWRLWMSKNQGISFSEWWSMTLHDLHLELWPLVQLCPPLDHRESRGTTTQGCCLFLLEPPFTVLWNMKSQTWRSCIRLYGPYWDLHHLQRDKETSVTYNTWKVESGGEWRIVLALASFSGGDETGGNGPSTTDNEETELCMKESIDLSAPHWCCKPHAPQWGAGVCCFLCFTNRLFPSSERSQYPQS